MVWEFPAVSQSRKEFWAKPQYTKSGMWWFTLVFGFFGLHHFLLRSPQTGLIFLIANIISLGYLWFYDLIQLSSEDKGGVSHDSPDKHSLDKHGLSWGFGALGLAKGMWIPGNENEAKSSASGSTSASAASASASASASSTIKPSILHPHGLISDQKALQLGYKMKIPQTGLYLQPQKVQEEITEAQKKKNLGQDEGQQVLEETQNNTENPKNPVQGGGANSDGPPNPFFFLAYAILIPIAPLAQLIAGDNYNSISRVLDLTIVPGGFFCYMASIIYDYIILFLFPADLLVFGSKRFFPFTFLGMDPDNHSPNITANVDYAPCPPDNMFITLIKIMIPLAKQIPGVSVIATAVETALATAQVVKTQVIEKGAAKVQQGLRVAGQVGKLASSLHVAAAGAAAASAPGFLALPQPTAPPMPYAPPAPPPSLYNKSMLDEDTFNRIQEQYNKSIIRYKEFIEQTRGEDPISGVSNQTMYHPSNIGHPEMAMRAMEEGSYRGYSEQPLSGTAARNRYISNYFHLFLRARERLLNNQGTEKDKNTVATFIKNFNTMPGTMVGGAIKSYNSLEYLTLGSLAALVGGGLLVGINRGLQNYTYTGKDDSPPNAGRV
jgi:hypothetical protein